MTPILTIVTLVAWLIGMVIAWAFVHGAKNLRRQEVATVRSAESGRDGQATVTSITPEAGQLPAAA